jgi:hypothetical protein
MPQVAGITTKKNTKGELTHVTINVKKHKEKITPILEELGVVKKSTFKQEWDDALANGALTPDELGASLKKYINKLWAK